MESIVGSKGCFPVCYQLPVNENPNEKATFFCRISKQKHNPQQQNQTFTGPSKEKKRTNNKQLPARLTAPIFQDDFALVLLEDVDEPLYLTETLPSAGTPVWLPQRMTMVSEMVGGTEKIQ